MKRFLVAAVLTVAGLGLLVRPAAAQMTYPYRAPPYGPFYTPQLSPYLNFLRGGDPSANYFLGVLPEFQRRTNARTFSAALADLESAELQQAVIDTGILNQLPSTGHPTVFNNTGTYFNTYANTFPSSRLPAQRGMRGMGSMGAGMGMGGRYGMGSMGSMGMGSMGMGGMRGMSIMPPSTPGR